MVWIKKARAGNDSFGNHWPEDGAVVDVAAEEAAALLAIADGGFTVATVIPAEPEPTPSAEPPKEPAGDGDQKTVEEPAPAPDAPVDEAPAPRPAARKTTGRGKTPSKTAPVEE